MYYIHWESIHDSRFHRFTDLDFIDSLILRRKAYGPACIQILTILLQGLTSYKRAPKCHINLYHHTPDRQEYFQKNNQQQDQKKQTPKQAMRLFLGM